MSKSMNDINFYVLANCLKNNIRQGWLDWSIDCDRVESDLQCKIYDEKGYVDVNNGFEDPYFKQYYGKGMSWSEM